MPPLSALITFKTQRNAMAWKKEFRLPRIENVPVVELELAGYGTIIIEAATFQQRGGNALKMLKEYGINGEALKGVTTSTRTREYLNNLPSFHGEK
jgi:hypothetical protein